MAYCGPRGIPLTQFLEWDPWDQDRALEWQAREASRCGSCGTPADVVDPQQGGHPHALIPVEDPCPVCAAIERFKARPDAGRGHGQRIRMVPNPHLRNLH